jgi:hypothetical protein
MSTEDTRLWGLWQQGAPVLARKGNDMATLMYDSSVRRPQRLTRRLPQDRKTPTASRPTPPVQPVAAVATPAAEGFGTPADWIVIGVAANLLVIAGLAFISRYTRYSTLTLASVELGVLAVVGGVLALAGCRKAGLLLLSLGAVPLIPVGLPACGCLLAALVETLAGKFIVAVVLCALYVGVRTWVTHARPKDEE